MEMLKPLRMAYSLLSSSIRVIPPVIPTVMANVVTTGLCIEGPYRSHMIKKKKSLFQLGSEEQVLYLK